MNNINIIRVMFITIFSFSALTSAVAQDVSTRLLPESFTKRVTINWQQDGRTIDIETINPKDKWVLKELVLEIRYPVEPAPETPFPKVKQKNSTRASESINLEAGERFLRELEATETVITKVEALPGRKASAIIELKHKKKAVEILLLESRGRELTRIERLKTTIF